MAELDNRREPDIHSAWTEIVRLVPSSREVNVRFKVITKGTARRVISKSSGRQYEISKCVVADATARIDLILWNDNIDSIHQDHSYCLLNGKIDTKEDCMSLTLGFHGEIKESDIQVENIKNDVDMSRPFMGKRKPKSSRPTTSRTLQGKIGREARGYASRKSF